MSLKICKRYVYTFKALLLLLFNFEHIFNRTHVFKLQIPGEKLFCCNHVWTVKMFCCSTVSRRKKNYTPRANVLNSDNGSFIFYYYFVFFAYPMNSFFETGWISDMVSAGHLHTTVSVIHHCHAQTIGSVSLKNTINRRLILK